MAIEDVLTPEAIEFLHLLERELGGGRDDVLAARAAREQRLKDGELPAFLSDTSSVRDGDWRVPPAPSDLADRRVEITGPTDRKMVINALNSGARVFMADFEDSNSPTWQNMIEGQRNLADAIDRSITFQQGDRLYQLSGDVATLVMRPRGWHMVERHFQVDGEPMSASLFDFGLYLFHNHNRLKDIGSGPYFYLPKLESHQEARLWNSAFELAQSTLGIPIGTVRATVLIETVLAAFEMDEILFELGPHASGLNAGRWDYLFSFIKKLGHRPEFVLPTATPWEWERHSCGRTPNSWSSVPSPRRACHRGMAAFIPSRRDPEVNAMALTKVREDKEREAGQGYDGTWVAHPDLVPSRWRSSIACWRTVQTNWTCHGTT